MPLYEYQCDACGNRFERIQRFSDPPVDVCPNCGAREVHKLLSTPAIQFKGSGWYVTDYARKGGDGAQPADKAAGKDEKAPAAASESKPASTESSSTPSTAAPKDSPTKS